MMKARPEYWLEESVRKPVNVISYIKSQEGPLKIVPVSKDRMNCKKILLKVKIASIKNGSK